MSSPLNSNIYFAGGAPSFSPQKTFLGSYAGTYIDAVVLGACISLFLSYRHSSASKFDKGVVASALLAGTLDTGFHMAMIIDFATNYSGTAFSSATSRRWYAMPVCMGYIFLVVLLFYLSQLYKFQTTTTRRWIVGVLSCFVTFLCLSHSVVNVLASVHRATIDTAADLLSLKERQSLKNKYTLGHYSLLVVVDGIVSVATLSSICNQWEEISKKAESTIERVGMICVRSMIIPFFCSIALLITHIAINDNSSNYDQILLLPLAKISLLSLLLLLTSTSNSKESCSTQTSSLGSRSYPMTHIALPIPSEKGTSEYQKELSSVITVGQARVRPLRSDEESIKSPETDATFGGAADSPTDAPQLSSTTSLNRVKFGDEVDGGH